MKVRLCIDFSDLESLKSWVRMGLLDETLPASAGVFRLDGLDVQRNSGVTTGNTYIVRREGDRPDQMRLNLEPGK